MSALPSSLTVLASARCEIWWLRGRSLNGRQTCPISAKDFQSFVQVCHFSLQERDWVLAQFKSGQRPVMVATDVAARGLDVPNVAAVINFDFPNGVEDYVHRIGRTGRAGATGDAFTFFTSGDGKYARELIKLLQVRTNWAQDGLLNLAGHGSELLDECFGGWLRSTGCTSRLGASRPASLACGPRMWPSHGS